MHKAGAEPRRMSEANEGTPARSAGAPAGLVAHRWCNNVFHHGDAGAPTFSWRRYSASS
jgi:hypothetical protein